MPKWIIVGSIIVAVAVVISFTAYVMKKSTKKTTYGAEKIEPIEVRKMGIYEQYIKRIIDVVCATGAIVVFSPIYLCIALLVRIKLGSPVIFTQDRPGLVDHDGKETIFKMYKFRSMTDDRNEDGELLPDDVRLTKFGKWLRNTSLDELPEAFNILNGTMTIIGPRPQLVRDLVFMSNEQRKRHTVKPGLSGLAQVSGRNGISWDEKLNYDLEYITNISLISDIQIVMKTVITAFVKQDGISQEGMSTAADYGDYLLNTGRISVEYYKEKKKEAELIIRDKK